MRKRRAGWVAPALVALGLMGALPGVAAAQSSQTPWLGVSTQEITENLREGLGYRGRGVLVSRVVRDSPADRAGVRMGDVIVTFNSRTVDTPQALVDLVRSARVGQSISLAVMRDGQRRSLTARLGEWPDRIDEMSDAPPAPRAPRAPRAPSSPRTYSFEFDGDSFRMPEDLHGSMLRVMGRARLGVHIQDINSDLGEVLGVPGGRGVLVTDVVEDSPAAKVGIKGGDVITEVGGNRVDDVADLQRELRDKEGRVRVTLMRRGARRTVEPELEARSEMRWRSGDDRRVIRIPEVRRQRVESDRDRRDLEAEIRELREELRELRRMMEDRRGN